MNSTLVFGFVFVMLTQWCGGAGEVLVRVKEGKMGMGTQQMTGGLKEGLGQVRVQIRISYQRGLGHA